MSINCRGEFRESSERPPAPWKPSKVPINLSWHHIIPNSMMRDSWQALIVNRDQGKCRVALESYMRLTRIDQPRDWLKCIMRDQLSFEQQLELDRKLTWPNWNIVEGPYYRSDDPKDQRSLDEFTSGLTRSEWNRQKRIKDLFTALQIFNRATGGGKFSEDAATGVASVMNNVERTLLSGDIIFFRAEMWTESNSPVSNSIQNKGVKYWRKKTGLAFWERSANPGIQGDRRGRD